MAYDKVVDSAKLDGAMSATADAIRGKTGGSDSIAWDEDTGFADAVDEVYEAGEKSEYDRFWDDFQLDGDGKRKTYLPYFFSGQGWNGRSFKPKHDIICGNNGANGLFRQSTIMNLKQILIDCGVTLDVSKATSLQYAFGFAALTKLPKIDMSSSTNNDGIFADDPVEEIDEIVVSKKTTFTASSFRCTKLKHMIVTGTIAKNNFNVSSCTLLDKESITSIINALSSTTSGLSVTISKTAKEAAFTADEWSALIAAKTNWTINLV